MQVKPMPKYLYHATFIHAIPAIQSGGLRPSGGSNYGGGYDAHSKGRIFLSDAGGISYWMNKLEMIANNQTDHPEEGWVPVPGEGWYYMDYDVFVPRSKTGSRVNVHNPLHNLREAVKQALLLEDHLFHPRKNCEDCISKHLLMMEALLEEAVTLDEAGTLCPLLGRLLTSILVYQTMWSEGRATAPQLAQALRKWRKGLAPRLVSSPKHKLACRIVQAKLKTLGRASLRTAAGIQVQEENNRVIVSGPYPLMAHIIPALKSRKFRYDSNSKSWWMSAQDMTPKKMESLQKLVAPYTNAVDPKAKLQQEIRDRAYKGFQITVPFDLRQVAKDNGGIWVPEDKQWAMPDHNSVVRVYAAIQEMKDALAPPSVDAQEIRARSSQGLLLFVPSPPFVTHDLTQLAKDNGGILDPSTKQWAMPDHAAKSKMKDIISGALASTGSNTPTPPPPPPKKESPAVIREIEKALKRDIDPKDILITSIATERRTTSFTVGDTFKDKGKVYIIGFIENPRKIEDGMSFGYTIDDGWLFRFHSVPADVETTKQVEQEEEKKLNRHQALTRREVLQKEFMQKRNFARAPLKKAPAGKQVLLYGKSALAYGGGSWFVLQPSKWIWFIKNNGSDGDTWANNNIPGAMAWRVRWDDGLAEELVALDKIAGE